jgi:hypothetical protein
MPECIAVLLRLLLLLLLPLAAVARHCWVSQLLAHNERAAMLCDVRYCCCCCCCCLQGLAGLAGLTQLQQLTLFNLLLDMDLVRL